MAYLIIFNILLIGFIGFKITLSIMGDSPKGKAISILAAIVSVGVYLFAATKIDPFDGKVSEFISNVLLLGPAVLSILGLVLGYIFKKPQQIDKKTDA